MISMYLFLRRNRLRKKWKLWKQLILLIFDFTTLFYVLAFLAYVVAAIYIEGNIAFNLHERIGQFEPIAIRSFWYIVTIIPLARMFQAFQLPGLIFSSAEYHLTILPYSRMKIWLILAVERWLKASVIYVMIGTVIYLLTPINLSVILTYVGLLLFLNIAMTAVEWKFFQQSIIVKITLVGLLMMINGISLFVLSSVIATGFIVLLILTNILLANRLFQRIDWQKVTAANDHKLWNMKAISYATNIKFKKDRKYSVWQRMDFWKKPFPYTKSALYHRLWHLYLEKNLGLILQLIGALLMLLVVLSFLPEWLFLLAIIVTISIYTTFTVTLFKDRLASDIVQVLPWDLENFKATFQQWILVSGIVFFIPLIIKALFNFTLWTVALWVVIMFTFYLLLNVKLQRAIMEMDKAYSSKGWLHLVIYGLFLIILFSDKYPVVLILGCLVIGIVPIFLRMQHIAR